MSDDNHIRAALNGLPKSPSPFAASGEMRQAPNERHDYIASLKQTHRYSRYEITDLVLAWDRDHEETAARERKAARLPPPALTLVAAAVKTTKRRRVRPAKAAVDIAEHVENKREKIAERDGWLCWLCGGPTLREWAYRPTALSPTLDHVRPKSKGGGRGVKNLKLAHHHCNHLRGTQTPQWAWLMLRAWALAQGFWGEYEWAPARTHGEIT